MRFALLFYPITLSKLALFTPAWLVVIALLARFFGARTSTLLSLFLPILAGVFLVKSAKMAHFMNKNIPGITIPQFILDEFERSTNPVNTSLEIAARLIRALRDLCQGVHIYTIHWEDKVPLVLDKAGF